MNYRDGCRAMFELIMRACEDMGSDVGYRILADHLAAAAKDNIALCEHMKRTEANQRN